MKNRRKKYEICKIDDSESATKSRVGLFCQKDFCFEKLKQ